MRLRCKSIMNSVRIFSWTLLLTLSVWLLAAPVHADVCVWRDPERTMQNIFPHAQDYKTLTVHMTPEKITAIEAVLGAPLDDSEKVEFNFYDIIGSNAGNPVKLGTLIALAGKGEYGVIEVVIGVNRAGKIVGTYIQRSRERATKALQSAEFLTQFTGKSKDDGFEIGTDIQPVSADAEAASRVVAFVVKKMLVFYDVLATGGATQ